MRSAFVSLMVLLLVSLYGVPVVAAEFVLPANNDSLIGEVQYVTTSDEDTLLDIGRRFGVGYEEMTAANPGIDPWVPGVNKRITIPTQYLLPDAPRTGIVVNVAEHRLYYYPKVVKGKAAVVQTFPVSLGKEDWSTPHGRTTIVAKITNPTWYPPASVRKEHADHGDYLPAAIPPGKDNPLGEFAMRMGFGDGTFLIHGTNKPTGIGLDVTHGCIRMFPEDIEHFFKEVPVGTSVLIVDQPYKMAWSKDRLYMEVHKSADMDEHAWREGLTNVTKMFVSATRDREVRINWSEAEAAYLSASGMPATIKLLD
jgi:L,D-transpeptidase ErfK/SrfK